jgi:DNA-binding GntR family transcriptional regulator
MTGKIIKVPSLKEQVYLYLKNAIIKHELSPDEVYSEQWVADRLGVSRTPVREAVLQLKQEYFLDVLPYKGFTVKEMSLDDVRDTFQIRQALEGFCIILISQNSQTDDVRKVLQKLDECLMQMQKFSDKNKPNDFVRQDALFHRAIIHYANNERLISTYNDIRFHFERITLQVLTEYGRMTSTINEHREICEMMRAGKPWEAYQAIQVHLQKTQKIMERKIVEDE